VKDESGALMMAAKVFRYRAAQHNGHIERGAIVAKDESAARLMLSTRGLFVVDLIIASFGENTSRRIPLDELALGLRVLADLLAAGVPLARCLDAFTRLAPRSWRDVVPDLSAGLQEGRSFADALVGVDSRATPVALGLIRSSEAAGSLSQGLREAAISIEMEIAMRSAIRSALAYPALLACAVGACSALLIFVVLPRFAVLLSSLNDALPQSTAILLSVGTVARAGALPFCVIAIATFLLWLSWTRDPEGRVAWHQFLLSLPIVGPIRQCSSTARATSVLASLLRGGIALPQALLLAGNATGDLAVEQRLHLAREAIMSGEGVAFALERSQAFIPSAVFLISTGEAGGDLLKLLEHASSLAASEAQRSISNSIRLIEPILIIAFSALVGFVAISLLQAVYAIRPH
jgi:type II secretory pathway component PulF